MPRLLIVHHSPTATLQRITDRVVAGAHDDAISGVGVELAEALTVGLDSIEAADGFLLGTSANFGYMSGALKHCFDRHFLAMGGELADDGSGAPVTGGKRPFGLWVHGRYDTTGAVRSVLAITGALPWRQAAEVLSVLGDPSEEQLAAAYELGGTIAALLSD
ncbi:MAG: flavodoxin family protein [Nocardioides sp.]